MDYSVIKVGEMPLHDFMSLMVVLIVITVMATMAALDVFSLLFSIASDFYSAMRSHYRAVKGRASYTKDGYPLRMIFLGYFSIVILIATVCFTAWYVSSHGLHG